MADRARSAMDEIGMISALSFEHLRPLGFALGALDRGSDEGHAFDAVVDRWEIQVLRKLLPAYFSGDRLRSGEVDIGEGLDEGFRMPEWRTRILCCGFAYVVVAASQNLARLVGVLDDELVGMLLMPF